ncbi:MAG TPA: carbohydrate ABC transporter permease [Capillimicrobium sp.]
MSAAVGGTRAGLALRYAVLLLLTAIFVLPLVWMLFSAFKPSAEVTGAPPTFFPKDLTGESFDTMFASGSQTPVARWFLNSMIAALGNTALVLLTATPAAYALARLEFRGKRVVTGMILATLFVPPIILLPANFLIVDELGWLDRLPSVIFPLAASAFGVFFLRQFLLGLPRELEEAARIDGATTWQTFIKVIVPLCKPALATLAVITTVTNWNDFLWPIYVLFSPESLTLSPGLALLQGAATTDYALIMAGAVAASVPVLVIFIFAQRFLIEGVARTGLKEG